MERLSSFDANFLYLETPSAHMHVGGLSVFDPSTAPDGFSFARVRSVYRDRIHLVPQFRRRLAEVPLQLDHPRWVDDPAFDLNWHIRHVAVPAPGGVTELAELTAELMSIQLDRDHPLWEVWVIEGLEGGRFATLIKAHHAALDGMGGMEIVARMYDLTPDVATVPPPPADDWQPRPVPGDLTLLARASASLALQPLRAVRALSRGVHSVRKRRKIVAAEGSGSLAATLPAGAPRVSFSAALTPERALAFRTLPLAPVLAVRRATGVTFNDVVLTVCGGGLRRYLAGRGEAVDGSLVAMVPMSIRGEASGAGDANQLMNMFIRLGTDIADPLERLASIAEQTAGAKAQLLDGEGDPVRELSEFTPATLTAHMFRFVASRHLAERVTPLFNLTMSNLAGSRMPLFLAGSLLVASYPMGPIYDGNALNITVMSYLDQIDAGIVACPALTPDVDRIPTALADELGALAAAAEAAT